MVELDGKALDAATDEIPCGSPTRDRRTVAKDCVSAYLAAEHITERAEALYRAQLMRTEELEI